MTFGRHVHGSTGIPIEALAGYDDARWRVGGITVDWGKVTAPVSDVALPGGWTQGAGKKALRHGQVMCEITATETQTVDLSGDDDPDGGTFDLTVPSYGTLEGVAWNVAAATLQTALEGLVGAGNVTVSKSSFVYTITFAKALGNVGTITVDSTALTTGGSTVTVTIATTHSGSSTSKYGPYDPAATDGRQTLTRGKCFVLNQTVFEENPLTGPFSQSNDHPAVFDGGTVWKARIIATTGTHTLAAGPTWTEFEAAFPVITYV